MSFLLILIVGWNLQGYTQDKNESLPSWWFGVSGAANYNRYHGYTSALNVDINASPAFDKGNGFGGYVAAMVEYHEPGTIWGVMLQQGIDNRMATFKNSGRRLEAKVSYLSTEPAIMLMPRRSHFYFYAGPRVGYVLSTPFTYKEPNSPEYPEARRNPKAYIKNVEKFNISAHAGVGYDLMLSGKDADYQFMISPFITYLPSLNQNLRTIETLKLNTIRAGVIFKAGRLIGDEH